MSGVVIGSIVVVQVQIQISSMTTVLPGTHVPAQHAKLKLGPGLLQTSNTNGSGSSVITTRVGILSHSSNKSKWWIESNSRRVHILHRYGGVHR